MFGPVIDHLSYIIGFADGLMKNGQRTEFDIYRFTGSF